MMFLPEGALMLLPGSFLFNFNRDFLNLPRLLLGVGVFCCWMIITVSSLSKRSISRAANSCSRCLKFSSCCLCCTCAFVSSSSLQRSSLYAKLRKYVRKLICAKHLHIIILCDINIFILILKSYLHSNKKKRKI